MAEERSGEGSNSVDIWEAVRENLPLIAGSLLSFITGAVLIADDWRDFGKTDRPTHHVYTGFIPFFAGLIGLGTAAANIAQKVNKSNVKAKKSKAASKKVEKEFKIHEYAPEILEALK